MLEMKRYRRCTGPRWSRPTCCTTSTSTSPGEFVAVIGPSGSGKSTLLNIARLLEELRLGRVLARRRRHPLARRSRRRTTQPVHRLRVPELQPAAGQDRARQRRRCRSLPGRHAPKAQPDRRAVPRARRPARLGRPHPRRDVRRPEAARRDRALAARQAAADPRRRADRRARQRGPGDHGSARASSTAGITMSWSSPTTPTSPRAPSATSTSSTASPATSSGSARSSRAPERCWPTTCRWRGAASAATSGSPR